MYRINLVLKIVTSVTRNHFCPIKLPQTDSWSPGPAPHAPVRGFPTSHGLLAGSGQTTAAQAPRGTRQQFALAGVCAGFRSVWVSTGCAGCHVLTPARGRVTVLPWDAAGVVTLKYTPCSPGECSKTPPASPGKSGWRRGSRHSSVLPGSPRPRSATAAQGLSEELSLPATGRLGRTGPESRTGGLSKTAVLGSTLLCGGTSSL